MRDVTFYIVGAYGVTALAVLVELICLRQQRRKVLDRARAESDNRSEN